MKLERHGDIGNDLRKLKKFAAPEESLAAWERLFCLKGLKEMTGIDPFPGFGSAQIYKGRVVPLKENFGKSKGYRVIFQRSEVESFKIIVFSRHGVYRSEKELIALIRERLH